VGVELKRDSVKPVVFSDASPHAPANQYKQYKQYKWMLLKRTSRAKSIAAKLVEENAMATKRVSSGIKKQGKKLRAKRLEKVKPLTTGPDPGLDSGSYSRPFPVR
jgi:hypothetical protein